MSSRNKTFHGMCFLAVFALLLLLKPAAADIIYSDSFSGDADVRPPNWKIVEDPIPESKYWYQKDGQFYSGNGDNVPVPDSTTFAVISDPNSSGWVDYEVSTNFWMPQNNGGVLLVGRWQNRNNHYQVRLTASHGSRIIKLLKVVNGDPVALETAIDGLRNVNLPRFEQGKSEKDSHVLVLRFKGDQIEVKLDDETFLSVNDSTYKAGSAGIGVWLNEVYFDNVIVNQVGTAAVASGTSKKMKYVYRVAVSRGVTVLEANKLMQRLQSKSIPDIEMVQSENGYYDVLQGNYFTRSEAERNEMTLKNKGIKTASVVRVSGAGLVSSDLTAQSFKVLMKIYDTRESAEKLKSTLEKDGYFPVAIIESGSKFQVVVGDFKDKKEADNLSESLKTEGYIVAEIISSNKLEVNQATGKNQIVEGGAAAFTDIEDIANRIFSSPTGKAMSRKQQKEMRDLIKNQVRLQAQEIVTDELVDVNNKIASLDAKTKSVYDEIMTELKERESDIRDRKKYVTDQFREIDRFITLQNWAEAKQILNELEAKYPEDGRIKTKREVIAYREEGDWGFGKAEVEGTLASRDKLSIENLWKRAIQNADSGAYLTAIADMEFYKTKTANDAEQQSAASAKITEWKRLDKEAIMAAQRLIDDQIGAAGSTTEYLVIGLGVLGAVVVLLVIIMIIGMFSRRRERSELRATLQNLSMQPMMEIGQPDALAVAGEAPPVAGTQLEGNIDVSRQLESPADQEDELPGEDFAGMDPLGGLSDEDSFIIDDSEREQTQIDAPAGEGDVQLEDVSTDAPENLYDPTLGVPAEQDDMGFSLGEAFGMEEEVISEEPVAEEAPVAEPEPEPEPVAQQPESISLDMPPEAEETQAINLGSEETQSINLGDVEEVDTLDNIELPIPELGGDSEFDIEESESTAILDIPNISGEDTTILAPEDLPELDSGVDDTVGVVGVGAAAGAVGGEAVETEPGVVFEQDFNAEAVGGAPANWNGQYDYASLTVANATPANDDGAYLRFEKSSGDGRAYCHCGFPEVSGKVRVEFDLRCDDKNKYLLGFYIEKDQDFKNSIHTVIHKTASQANPMLRIHGVPVDYEMGQWVKIRYDINLTNGTINGFVDGNMVASNQKLDTNPGSLNTLAIRDNNPTTGIMLIDNIKISKF